MPRLTLTLWAEHGFDQAIKNPAPFGPGSRLRSTATLPKW